jgi:hypothetical protein
MKDAKFQNSLPHLHLRVLYIHMALFSQFKSDDSKVIEGTMQNKVLYKIFHLGNMNG